MTPSASAGAPFYWSVCRSSFASSQGQCSSTRSRSSSLTLLVSISPSSTKRRIRASCCGERSSYGPMWRMIAARGGGFSQFLELARKKPGCEGAAPGFSQRKSALLAASQSPAWPGAPPGIQPAITSAVPSRNFVPAPIFEPCLIHPRVSRSPGRGDRSGASPVPLVEPVTAGPRHRWLGRVLKIEINPGASASAGALFVIIFRNA